VLPREEGAVQTAGVKTKVLKYLSDVNNSPFQRSRAFEDAVKGGIGWTEVGVRSDPGAEPIYNRYESWRYIWFDSFGNELDQSDWRYMFRAKSIDTDIGEAYFPDRGTSSAAPRTGKACCAPRRTRTSGISASSIPGRATR
jgi:hypothetical protein